MSQSSLYCGANSGLLLKLLLISRSNLQLTSLCRYSLHHDLDNLQIYRITATAQSSCTLMQFWTSFQQVISWDFIIWGLRGDKSTSVVLSCLLDLHSSSSWRISISNLWHWVNFSDHHHEVCRNTTQHMLSNLFKFKEHESQQVCRPCIEHNEVRLWSLQERWACRFDLWRSLTQLGLILLWEKGQENRLSLIREPL